MQGLHKSTLSYISLNIFLVTNESGKESKPKIKSSKPVSEEYKCACDIALAFSKEEKFVLMNPKAQGYRTLLWDEIFCQLLYLNLSFEI